MRADFGQDKRAIQGRGFHYNVGVAFKVANRNTDISVSSQTERDDEYPMSSIRFCSPASAMRRSASCLSGPSPNIRIATSFLWRATEINASIKLGMFFSQLSLPAKMIKGRPSSNFLTPLVLCVLILFAGDDAVSYDS